jgi:hypothetical protein
MGLAINHNLKIDKNFAVDLDDGYIEILKEPNWTQSKLEQIKYENEQNEIEYIIKLLIPICKRAKESDESWENNFFNNKIIRKVKQQLK